MARIKNQLRSRYRPPKSARVQLRKGPAIGWRLDWERARFVEFEDEANDIFDGEFGAWERKVRNRRKRKAVILVKLLVILFRFWFTLYLTLRLIKIRFDTVAWENLGIFGIEVLISFLGPAMMVVIQVLYIILRS